MRKHKNKDEKTQQNTTTTQNQLQTSIITKKSFNSGRGTNKNIIEQLQREGTTYVEDKEVHSGR